MPRWSAFGDGLEERDDQAGEAERRKGRRQRAGDDGRRRRRNVEAGWIARGLSSGVPAGGAASNASSAGIQRRAAGDADRPPLRSITVAPAAWAAGPCFAANAGEPVKNTNCVLSKLNGSMR